MTCSREGSDHAVGAFPIEKTKGAGTEVPAPYRLV